MHTKIIALLALFAACAPGPPPATDGSHNRVVLTDRRGERQRFWINVGLTKGQKIWP